MRLSPAGSPRLLLTTRMLREASQAGILLLPANERDVLCSCDGIFIPDITMANLYSLEQDFVITSQCANPCIAVSTIGLLPCQNGTRTHCFVAVDM